jgi:hypothetical protein
MLGQLRPYKPHLLVFTAASIALGSWLRLAVQPLGLRSRYRLSARLRHRNSFVMRHARQNKSVHLAARSTLTILTAQVSSITTLHRTRAFAAGSLVHVTPIAATMTSLRPRLPAHTYQRTTRAHDAVRPCERIRGRAAPRAPE